MTAVAFPAAKCLWLTIEVIRRCGRVDCWIRDRCQWGKARLLGFNRKYGRPFDIIFGGHLALRGKDDESAAMHFASAATSVFFRVRAPSVGLIFISQVKLMTTQRDFVLCQWHFCMLSHEQSMSRKAVKNDAAIRLQTLQSFSVKPNAA
jgi:hypothetical protein